MKQVISNSHVLNEAPEYGAAFSRGIKKGNMVFISGTASIDMFGKSIHIDDFTKQCERMFYNVTHLLFAAGCDGWHDVVKTTFYIKDIEANYAEFNRIRNAWFAEKYVSPFPASVCVEAKLCRPELLIEMDATAIIDPWSGI